MKAQRTLGSGAATRRRAQILLTRKVALGLPVVALAAVAVRERWISWLLGHWPVAVGAVLVLAVLAVLWRWIGRARQAGRPPGMSGREAVATTMLGGITAVAISIAEWVGSGDPLDSATAGWWGAVAVLGVFTILYGAWLEWGRQRAVHGRRLDTLLAVPPPRPGELPTLSQVSPYGAFRVSPSKYVGRGDPYVARPATDSLLSEALSDPSCRFVLVTGDSAAGKSRTAYEAARNYLGPTARLIVPKPEALAELVQLRPPIYEGLGRAVLLLDDLERYLGHADGLDSGILDLIARDLPQVVVLATLTSDRWVELQRMRREVAQTLGRFRRIELATNLTREEKVQAERLYQEERFEIDRGIGAQFVAVWQAEQLYRDGPRLHPTGWSIVQAAIDWRRSSMTRPVPASVLRELAQVYVALLQPRVHRRFNYVKGLQWALEQPLESPVKLLTLVGREPGPTYAPFDYLVQYANRQPEEVKRRIPAAAWGLIAGDATPAEAVFVGLIAYWSHEPAEAEPIWRRVIESGEEKYPLLASIFLGFLLREREDLEGARAAFQHVVDLGPPEIRPMAMVELGDVIGSQGDLEGAEVVLHEVIESGDQDCMPRAAERLGDLLAQRGDAEGAKDAYELAIQSRHPEACPRAMAKLGELLLSEDDVEGARTAFQSTIDLGNADVTPVAFLLLGDLNAKQDDVSGARAAYQTAMNSGHPEAAPLAAVKLGIVLRELGDTDGAQAAWQTAVAAEHPDAAPHAATLLGLLLEDQSDADGAEVAYRIAVDSGHRDWMPLSARALGDLLKDSGRSQEALIEYRRAMESRHADPQVVAEAAFQCGALLEDDDDIEGALAAYQIAIDTDHPKLASLAKVASGMLLANQGDIASARARYEDVMEHGHSEARPSAAVLLGFLLLPLGEIEHAQAAFEFAKRTGSQNIASLAAAELERLAKASDS